MAWSDSRAVPKRGRHFHNQEIQKTSAQLLVHGYQEFGLAGEAYLGHPEVVVQVIAKMRGGETLEEAVLTLIYRQARQVASLREELVAWLARRLLLRGHQGVARALRSYPMAGNQPFDSFLLNECLGSITTGRFPGVEALVGRLASLLGDSTEPQMPIRTSQPEMLVLAMFSQPPLDREILRRALAGENAQRIANALNLTLIEAERAVVRSQRNARRFVRLRGRR